MGHTSGPVKATLRTLPSSMGKKELVMCSCIGLLDRTWCIEKAPIEALRNWNFRSCRAVGFYPLLTFRTDDDYDDDDDDEDDDDDDDDDEDDADDDDDEDDDGNDHDDVKNFVAK